MARHKRDPENGTPESPLDKAKSPARASRKKSSASEKPPAKKSARKKGTSMGATIKKSPSPRTKTGKSHRKSEDAPPVSPALLEGRKGEILDSILKDMDQRKGKTGNIQNNPAEMEQNERETRELLPILTVPPLGQTNEKRPSGPLESDLPEPSPGNPVEALSMEPTNDSADSPLQILIYERDILSSSLMMDSGSDQIREKETPAIPSLVLGFILDEEEDTFHSGEALRDKAERIRERIPEGYRASCTIRVRWDLLEPEQGKHDLERLENLREFVAELHRHGIEPAITLFHDRFPRWWGEKGGWSHGENLVFANGFAEFVSLGMADLVDRYITFAAPNRPAARCYGRIHDPDSVERRDALRSMRNRMIAHFHLYDRIKEIYLQSGHRNPRISASTQYRIFEPQRSESVLDRNRALSASRRFNLLWSDSLQQGVLLPPLGDSETIHEGGARDFFSMDFGGIMETAFRWSRPLHLFTALLTEENGRFQGEDLTMRLAEHIRRTQDRYRLPLDLTIPVDVESGTLSGPGISGNSIRSAMEAVKRVRDAGVPLERVQLAAAPGGSKKILDSEKDFFLR